MFKLVKIPDALPISIIISGFPYSLVILFL